MQRPLDLYSLFRLKDVRLVGELNRLMSGKPSTVRKHEIESLRGLCNALITAGAKLPELDGYYFSYVIPKIGKEFDVLRISDDFVLNIELKYVNVGIEEIAEQQRRNEYYLKSLGKKIFICTYVCDENKFYTVDSNGRLTDCLVHTVMKAVKATNEFYTEDPDRMFDPEDYIFSPSSDPVRLLEGRYFLTQHQESIKKRILSVSNSERVHFACVSGGSGTGKTLLLYDIALKASSAQSVCVISPNVSSDEKLKSTLNTVVITDPNGYLSTKSEKRRYDIVFVDDAHLIPSDILEQIIKDVRRNGRFCVFFTEAPILLCASERTARFWRKITRLVGAEKHQLTDRIRTDPTIADFINRMLAGDSMAEATEKIAYGDAFVLYAANRAEASLLIDKYTDKGYFHYSPTTAKEKRPPCGKRLITLGKAFSYDSDGRLRAGEASNSDILMENLVFNGLKGIDGSLGVLVVGNLPLFKKLIEFFK